MSTKKDKQPEVMVIDATDRRASSWILDGSEEGGNPQRLDYAKTKIIKTTSAIKVPSKEGGYTLRKIRYIKGCDTIFVDEQEKRGVKPNPAVDKADLEITHGTKTIVRNGATIAMFDYFRNYEGNIDNPNRPDGAVDDFRELKTVQTAEEKIDAFDAENEAREYLKQLKVNDAKKGVTYKEKEIDFLCSLFKVPYLSSFPEKFEALINIAKETPARFNESIANAKSAVIAEVNLAERLGVVLFDNSKAMLANNNIVLTSLSSTKEDERIEELAMHFLTTEGEMSYKQFGIELRAAKERAAAQV